MAIVGGGPGGLAAAIEVALRGGSAVVLERRSGPLDKACGEGLMPSGLAALERIGARALIDPAACSPFTALRFVQEDGRFVEGLLPAPGGLGVRRLALSAALRKRAHEVGVEVREGTALRSHQLTAEGARLETDRGELQAGLLVAADGLHSKLRKEEGLEKTATGRQRFGMRRHFRKSAHGAFVEVHFAAGVEAYLTPSGTDQSGVAFLWEGQGHQKVSFESLLARFPLLEARFAGAEPTSDVQGAGPLLQSVTATRKDRFVLLGDASGYIDAITGEGLSQALGAAAALGEVFDSAKAANFSAESLQPYSRALQTSFKRYASNVNGLLFLVRRPALRRALLNRLIAWPSLFGALLRKTTSAA